MSAAAAPIDASEMRSMLGELQDETILLTLPALGVAGLGLFMVAGRFPLPLAANLAGMVLLVLAVAAWGLRGRSYPLSGWVLVAGLSLVDLLAVAGARNPTPLYLLALVAGLAAQFVGVVAGVGVAALYSVFLLLPPRALPATDLPLRLTALIGIWGTVGLTWLSTRPLLTILQWSWASYERSRQLLEQARDYQVRLKQTLADLADANLQLTRLNRLAQALRQAAEDARLAKEQFVANVSHELRTPLNMIVGFTEMILQAPKTYGRAVPPALLADLAVIARNSQHLSSLIDDVLDLSQIEAGQMALTRERASLREIMEAAAVAVRPLYHSKGLYLEIEAPDDGVIYCDRTRIREVVLNLLSNAGRFTEQGGVRVRARRDGGDYVVSVADTGPGIGANERERLFQPFRQLDASLRRRYGGTGLGLAISKSFVELHGGRMWVESDRGQGATFYFRLPAEPPSREDGGVARWFNPHWHYEERLRPSLAPAAVVRPRFVVLEPGNTLQRLLSRYLDGAEIVPVADLESAIAELGRVPAQALLANSLRAGDGLEQLQQAGPLPFGTPAIFCSLPATADAASALGVDGYLVKPISREALLGALDRLPLKGDTILVVDDEPEALQLYWRMLASADRGYRVLTAADGRQALDILRQERPAAILLDLVMPQMDGFRLLEARAQDPQLASIPVVITSARDPAGQPVVSYSLAVARGGGLSLPQLLACIEALTAILGAPGQAADPGPRADLPA